MIIVVAPLDAAMVSSAQAQSQANPAIYGATVTGPPLPLAGQQEDVFFTGHGLGSTNTSVAEIGDEDGRVVGALSFDGISLWTTYRGVFPAGYTGNVYIDVCEAADFPDDGFSLIETFHSQSDIGLPHSRVYGRSGDVGYDIPPPGDASWRDANPQ